MAPRSRFDRIGGHVDHPLKVLAVDLHRTGIELQRSDVFEEDWFSDS